MKIEMNKPREEEKEISKELTMDLENWEKQFDERYDQYNPINDTGEHIPTWSGSDYQDIKDFISKVLSSQLKEIENIINTNTDDGVIVNKIIEFIANNFKQVK